MGQDMNRIYFKVCGKKFDYGNSFAVENVINYIFREDGRRTDNIYGSIGTVHKSKNGIVQDFYKLKRLYDKEDGLQVKHFMLSWGKRPEMPRKKMRRLIKQTLRYWSRHYQTVYAVHEDKMTDGHRYHMHIVLNSVSNTGRKIQIRRKELDEFKKKFNDIWRPYGYELEYRKTGQ